LNFRKNRVEERETIKSHNTPIGKTKEKKQVESPHLSSQRPNSRLERYQKASDKLKVSEQLDYTSHQMPLVRRNKEAKSNSKIKTDIPK